MATNQSVNTSARNINLIIDTDYPDFDLLINGYKYETNPQTNKIIHNGYGSNRSNRTNQQVSNSNALQRAIEYNLYQKNKRF